MQDPARQSVAVIFHGTFGPPHQGHMVCLRSALQFLHSSNIHVASVAIGTTTLRQAARKAGEDRWIEDEKRHALLCALVKDEKLEPIAVDNTACSTSHKLAVRHSSTQLPPIYVMGSDVQRRPSRNTLIVARAGDKFVEGFNPITLAGVCLEQQSTHLSSTVMRAMLSQGLIHSTYGDHSRRLLKHWQPTLRLATPQEEAAFAQRDQPEEQQQPANPDPLATQTTPAGSRGVTWTAEEMELVYGTGYRLMKKLGYDTDAAPPIIGIQRASKLGIQDNESVAYTDQARRALTSRPTTNRPLRITTPPPPPTLPPRSQSSTFKRLPTIPLLPTTVPHSNLVWITHAINHQQPVQLADLDRARNNESTQRALWAAVESATSRCDNDLYGRLACLPPQVIDKMEAEPAFALRMAQRVYAEKCFQDRIQRVRECRATTTMLIYRLLVDMQVSTPNEYQRANAWLTAQQTTCILANPC
eukprot:4031629-Amphidinium_carterae.1